MGGVTVVDGVAYVATEGSIRSVDLSTGAVGTLAGHATLIGCTDSTTPTSVRFKRLLDVETDGTYLYVADDCHQIRRVEIATGATDTLASYPSAGLGWEALTVAGGYVYAARCCNVGVDRIEISTGTIELDWLDSVVLDGISKQVNNVHGLAVDSTDLWVSGILSTYNDLGLLRVDLSNPNDASWYSGSTSLVGSHQLASAGRYLYAGAPGNRGIVRITKRTGAIGGVAGATQSGGSNGDEDGEWSDARFETITGVASDGNNLWVADGGNYRFKRIEFAPVRARQIGPGRLQDASQPGLVVGQDVNSASGNFSHTETDISLPGIGLPFTFTRYFNSFSASSHLGSWKVRLGRVE